MANLKHGYTHTPVYGVWCTMKTRCTNPKSHKWKDYGGRGITFDPSWSKFENFLADMGQPLPGMTLDRKNTDGPYSKANCHWATQKHQQRNRRNNRLVTLNGKTQSLAAWCEEKHLPYPRVQARLDKLGWTLEEALT